MDRLTELAVAHKVGLIADTVDKLQVREFHEHYLIEMKGNTDWLSRAEQLGIIGYDHIVPKANCVYWTCEAFRADIVDALLNRTELTIQKFAGTPYRIWDFTNVQDICDG